MYNLIEIQDYELIFEPFLFQIKVSGQFEIKSRYQIPPQSLFSSITFPNQEITRIELVPDKRTKCKSNEWSCQVFRINSFFRLSGDKYYSREIKSQEEIPFRINFELGTDNQQYFLNLNSIKSAHDNNYIDLITQIKLLNIQNSFKFQNTFQIERHKYGKTHYELDLPSKWRIYRQGKQYSYDKLSLYLPSHDEISNHINSWFAIKNAKGIEIISSEASLLINSRSKELPLEDLNTRWTNNDLYFYNSISNYSDKAKQGILKTKTILKLKNASYALNIKNHFSYKSPNASPKKIKIIRKQDEYFKNLKLFRWIEI